jgi:hypothetical protein
MEEVVGAQACWEALCWKKRVTATWAARRERLEAPELAEQRQLTEQAQDRTLILYWTRQGH